MSSIAILGAGLMGRAGAGRLLPAGFRVTAFDPAPAARDAIAALGAELAATPADAAAGADLVLMFLPGPAEVAACVRGPGGLEAARTAGGLVADLSTVDPSTSARMAALLEPRGVAYLDAPVLGRPASVGQWTLAVGGPAAALAQARPVLEHLAGAVIHVGPSGTGNKIKLLNQLMFGAINAATAEIMAIAVRMDLPPRQVFETIAASRAATVSPLFTELGRRVAAEDYAQPTFTLKLLEKDVRLAVQMAVDHQAPPLLGRMVQVLNEMACSQGAGDLDTAAMWRCIGRCWAGAD
jgi:3-hydroxyisobutyrate dehydrogenase-like beta-hydroxyacid dehydrogenase